jgi:hypothetical protein
MEQTVFVIPAKGPEGKPLFVPDPDVNFARLPDDGALKPHNLYWERRIRDGDVTVRTAAVPPSRPTAEAEKK